SPPRPGNQRSKAPAPERNRYSVLLPLLARLRETQNRCGALDLVERQGEKLVQILTSDGTRFFQLKQDLMRQHEARRANELTAGVRGSLAAAQGEGHRHLSAAPHDLLGDHYSGRIGHVSQLHL